MITNEILEKNGFTLEFVSIEESGDEPFCYWVLDMHDRSNSVSLITDECSIDQKHNNAKPKKIRKLCEKEWTVTLFDGDYGFCETEEQLERLVESLKRMKPKRDE